MLKDAMDPTGATRGLVVSDGGALTGEVVRGLVNEGWRVSVLDLSDTNTVGLPQQVRLYSCPASEPELRELAASVVAELGGLDAFIYLDREWTDAQPAQPQWHAQKARLRGVFALAGQLKSQLATADAQPRKTFMTVTRLDGAFEFEESRQQPLGAATFGLTKSLAWEWPMTFCRALDLKAGLPPQAAARQLLAELRDPQRGLVQVGWDGSARRSVVAAEIADLDAGPANAVAAADVFLVSGGARGVTADCVLELARSSRCRFVLIGRSALDAELPAWASPADDETQLRHKAMQELGARGDKPTPVKVAKWVEPILAQRESQAFLEQLRSMGSDAVYVQCDVTRAEALRSAVARASAPLGPITGIIHGAGVLADKFIEKKTLGDFDRVFDTKVEGLAALLTCAEPGALRHCMLFSSVAGFFGNRGQADYAMANEVLNAWGASIRRSHPNAHVVSFNWGPWNGGMVSPALRTLLQQQGIPLVDRQGGAEVFFEALSDTRPTALPHLLVGATVQPTRAQGPRLGRTLRSQRLLEADKTPLLSDHSIGGKVVLPMTHAASWLVSSSEDVYPGESFYRLENLKLFKGVIFDEGLPEVFDVTMTEAEPARAGERRVAAQISAPHKSGRQQPYYRADVLLRSTPVPERLADSAGRSFTDFDLRQDAALVGRDPYRDGTLFHGPGFQQIKRVLNITEDRITVECSGARIAARDAGQFRVGIFDPYRFDACFQAILVWVRERYRAASLPVGLAWGEMYSVLPDTCVYYVTVRIVSHSAASVVCDLFTHDARGHVYGQLSGAKVIVSRDLGRLFAAAPATAPAGVRAPAASVEIV